ncbi:DMT family transporter [Campylobacter canadensis]|uniref:DMT family transporter n=1 Tax=Campylobacter canadensis TaxID=449520 RepID=A0ABS7WRZ2_9BACT|nr:DMT family transporter [Campylobacter canadensis]MBZ7987521.1 DMT family transporter [Campylobacter canadensis]MBZ7994864.1 DMT family transporter [Campylobacter canadensis]MBZ7996352.1 DMT family transporter [Campylobacter canadensis]MBZ7998385.1 DMT family transporter [Campylobacter canadensis]MBZ8000100.1 DMT family transporter [Campylobacter canadensis]
MKQVIRKNLGIYFMILASFAFSLMGSFAKLLSNELNSIEIMFFRNIIGVFFLYYLYYKIPHKKSGGKPLLLILRGIFGTISLYAFFYNVSNISLGGAFAFQKTNPLFVALIAFLFLNEKLSLKAVLCLFISFIGVLLIVQPFAPEQLHSGFDLKNSLLGIASGLFAALALTSVRELGKVYNTEIIAISFFLSGSLLPIFSMLAVEFKPDLMQYDFAFNAFKMPSFLAFIYIIFMGIFSCLYQLYVTKAYKAAKKAGIVAGVGYLDVVITLLIGLLLGDDLPSFLIFLGIILILFGGIGLSLFKR